MSKSKVRTMANDRQLVFEGVKKSRLYTDPQAKDDIDTLIGYLSVDIEYGSANALLGGIQLQNKVLDELPWLAGYPSIEPTLPLDKALARLHEIREKYDGYIRKVNAILKYGIERYAFEHYDEADQFYVPRDERSASVDPYIERKPKTLEEMNRLASYDTGMHLEQSVWHEVYGDDYFGLYYTREKVGFDRVKLNFDIKSIDRDKLLAAKKKYKGRTYSDLPRIVVEYTDPDDEDDTPVVLPLPKEENHFKKIEVTLSHYVTFLIQRNNSPLEDSGRKKRDIYLLKMTVVPQPYYEFLGNIDNYSYDELEYIVSGAVKMLKAITGIEIYPNTIRLNDVELNLTFRQDCDFNDLMRSVSYYQLYTRKGYTTQAFKASDEGILFYCGPKKRSMKEKYDRMKVTGYTTMSQSVRIKLYDKKAETIAYAESQGYDLRIEGDALIRLEFEIRNPEQLKRYFDTGTEPVYLCNLSQTKIEQVYRRLVDIFFKTPYEKSYVPDSLTTLRHIVESLDTSVKGGKWKLDLLNAVRSEEIYKQASPALLKEEDITDVLQYNHTFKRKPSRYRKEVWKVLQESETFQNGQSHAYDMLFNFLHKTYDQKTLSEHRRLGFAVAIPGSKLPNVSDEYLAMRLHMNQMYVNMMNIKMEDFNDSTAAMPK